MSKSAPTKSAWRFRCFETCVIDGKDITGDALLTQRAIATYIVQQAGALSFHGQGQPTGRWNAILLCCSKARGAPDFVELSSIRSRPHRNPPHLVQHGIQ